MRRGGDENVVRYAAPEEDEELDIDEKQPLSEVASRLDLLEVELDECRKELDDLMEVVNRLGALSPVEVALEAGEDFFDGVEEEAEEIGRHWIRQTVQTRQTLSMGEVVALGRFIRWHNTWRRRVSWRRKWGCGRMGQNWAL